MSTEKGTISINTENIFPIIKKFLYSDNEIFLKAVEEMYGVTVASVSTIRQFGKTKSRMTKSKVTSGRTSITKKAVVTVGEGELIDFYADL